MKTIRMKFFSYFLVLVLVLVAVFYLGIQLFFEDYYYHSKVRGMQQTASTIETIYSTVDSPLDRLSQLEVLGMGFEGKISIIDENVSITIADDYALNYANGTIIKTLAYRDGKAFIFETNFPVKGSQWLIYSETLNDGKIAALQIPVIAIDKSIAYIERFTLYLGGIAVLLALFGAFIASGNVTKPIKRLNQLANDLGRLDFSAKYEGSRQDEIGQLGKTFNYLSSELQKAFADLQKELAKEKQLDRLRKQFVAQVSHELQTPLSIINGYVEALQDGIVDSDQETEEYYQVIRDESGKMSRMIKELLELSELEAGTFKMAKESFDLTDSLRDMFQRYELAVRHEDVELSLVIHPEKMLYTGDEGKLMQAIANIVNNGIKHAPPGGQVTLELLDRILTVENDGEPIDEKDLPWIWDSFYKGKNGTKKSGTGLGLAIAAGIFKHHNIDFSAENTESGVRFTLSF